MQGLRQATAVFCMACIAAELVTLLAGSSWSARCIKPVAGLYILAVFVSLLPGASAELQAAVSRTMTGASSASLPGPEVTEEQVLTAAAASLEQTCIVRCRQKFGVDIRLSITLETVGQETAVARVFVQFPAECNAAQKQNVRAYLQQELGIAPEAVEERTS